MTAPRPRLWPLMLRECRGSWGRMTFFVACLAVGVAAVVAVAGVAGGLDSGLQREARRLLAADLVVEGPEPIPEAVGEALEELAGAGGRARRAEVRELVTMVSAEPAHGRAYPSGGLARSAVADTSGRKLPDRPWTSSALRRTSAPAGRERSGRAASPAPKSQLVELKVVEGGYPFYGELKLEPDRPLEELLEGNGVVAAPELMKRLGLSVGDPLRLGGVEARIAGVVRSEPDRLGGAFGFSAGPRLFAGPELFDRTGLERVGSRIRYRALVALPPEAPRDATEAWAERLRQAVPPEVFEVETWTEAQPALRAGLARAERFLGLVALLSLLVGGIGVGQTVRAWLAGRLDAVAVLECIGLRPREVALVYAGQVALLGLAGSLVGAVAGVALQLAVPRIGAGLVPPELIDPIQPGALARGVGLGLGVALLFGLPSLSTVLRVPPVRVLRRTVEPLPVPRPVAAATATAVLGGVWATASVQSGSALLGAQFTLGAVAAAGLLAGAAWGLSRLVGRLSRRPAGASGRFWLRHGLAALARPGSATLAAVVALGLGVLVVVALWLVERRLTDELVGNLPEDAPSVFLVDVQPEQWDGVRRILREEGATGIDSVPVVMARLSAVDGVDVGDMAPPEREADRNRDEGERRWALTREQRLTYLEELPEGNRIVAGELWSPSEPPAEGAADPNEVSVEEEFARELGVGLGSTLRFDVQGVPVELTVTSLRQVDWSTFGINFFLVVEPGVLDRAPQHRIAAAQVPPEAETRLQDRIVAAYPNVTVLQMREILDKVVTTLRRIADGVRFVGAFTVLAGIAILAGAVSAGAVRRRREVALLKTLGTTRAGVVGVYAVEYALVGLVAGAIGCGGAVLLARTVLVRGMDVPWVFEPLPLLAALGTTVALTVIAGLAASAKALQSRPVEVLRSR